MVIWCRDEGRKSRGKAEEDQEEVAVVVVVVVEVDDGGV